MGSEREREREREHAESDGESAEMACSTFGRHSCSGKSVDKWLRGSDQCSSYQSPELQRLELLLLLLLLLPLLTLEIAELLTRFQPQFTNIEDKSTRFLSSETQANKRELAH